MMQSILRLIEEHGLMAVFNRLVEQAGAPGRQNQPMAAW